MSAISYTPLGEGTFTTQQLDRNFAAISDYTIATEQDLRNLAQAVESISSALLETAKKVSKLEGRPSKFKVVVAVAGAAYVGYQLGVLYYDTKAEAKFQGQFKDGPIHTDATRV